MALDGVCKKKIKGGTRNGHKTKAVIYTMECVLKIQHCLVLDKKKTKTFFFSWEKKFERKILVRKNDVKKSGVFKY
jgi:hypothetical protein